MVRGGAAIFLATPDDIAAGQTRKSAAARGRQQGLFFVFIRCLFLMGWGEPAGASGALPLKKAQSGLELAFERRCWRGQVLTGLQRREPAGASGALPLKKGSVRTGVSI